MRWLDSITDSMDMNLSKLWEKVEDSGAYWAIVTVRSQRVRYDLATEHQHCSLPLYTTLFCCGSFSGMRIEFFPETLAFCLVHYSLFGNKVQSRLQHQDISAVEGEVSSPVTKVSSV